MRGGPLFSEKGRGGKRKKFQIGEGLRVGSSILHNKGLAPRAGKRGNGSEEKGKRKNNLIRKRVS